MRKLGLLLGLLGVTASASTVLATNGGWVKYRARHLSFPFSLSHPTDWRARFAGYVTSASASRAYLIVALSTERLHRPVCHTVSLPNGDITEECNRILDALPPDGVYIEWWADLTAANNPKLIHTPGNVTHVGGALAKIVIDPTSKTAGWSCPTETTGSATLYIAGTQPPGSPLGRPFVSMYACTNTANFPRFMAQLLPMVRSVRMGQHPVAALLRTRPSRRRVTARLGRRHSYVAGPRPLTSRPSARP